MMFWKETETSEMSPPVPMVSKQDVSILLPYLGFQSLALNVVNVILIFRTLHIQGIHTIQCHRLYHPYLVHRFQPKK